MSKQEYEKIDQTYNGHVKDFSEKELIELIGMLEQVESMDPDLYHQVLKRMTQLSKHSKLVHKNSKKHAKVARKLSLTHKKNYLKISKKIIKLLKDDKISEELKFELIKVLREITSYLDAADARDKEFLSTQQKKVLSYGSLMLVTVAAMYGVKSKK